MVRAAFSKNDAAITFFTEMRNGENANQIQGIPHSGMLVELAVGDTIKLQVYHNEGSTEPTEPVFCFFGGYRLSS